MAGSSELSTRLLLGSTMLALIAGVYWLDSCHTGGRVSAVLLALAAFGGVYEYGAMLRGAGRAVALPLLLLMTAGLGACGVLFEWQQTEVPLAALSVATLLLFLTVAVRSLAAARMERSLEEQGATLLAFVWIALPLYLGQGLAIRHLPSLMYVLLICKGGDIGAYFVGSAIGRHKLIPHVSKGKTVEGAFGGVVFSSVIAVVLAPWLTPAVAGISWPGALAIGVVLNVLAQLGDLVESLLKRSCDTKDSSALLPAHGGVLDLVDSLLFSVPAYFVLLVYLT